MKIQNTFNPSELRWLYIDFNSYFASVEQQLRPELRGRPVAVVPVKTDSTCAIAASYEAKAFGVKTGTPIYEARRMCPGLVCVVADHQRYVDFHHRILEEVDRHIPVTAVCSIDEVACHLMNNETTPPQATAIAHAIKKGLAKRVGEYIRCSIGIAPNRYLAKIATDLKKPDGLTLFDHQDFPYKLLPLKLSDLPGIGRNMELRLTLAGIHTISDLLALSPARMRAVWKSVWGERLWYLLRGWDLPEEPTERKSVSHSHVLAPELRSPSLAFQIAHRLTIKAASRLRRMGYYAQTITLGVRLESGEKLWIDTACQPAYDSFTLLHLLQAQWAKIIEAMPPRSRIKKLGVTLQRLTPADASHGLQHDLFHQKEIYREKCERVSHAMDRLNHKYGRDAILLGLTGAEGKNFTGTKVAFNRIPDREEFWE